MLKKRIIVTLLSDGKGLCVKPVGFDHNYMRPVGTLMDQIELMAERNIDELIILDVLASKENRPPNFKLIEKVTEKLFCPLTLGGGINKLEHIRSALNSGADKVALGGSLSQYNFIENAASYVGSQSIVGCVDVVNTTNNKGWHNRVAYICSTLQKQGVGEIILTDCRLDGTMLGYNYSMIKTVCSAPFIRIPIIANGGCGSPEHIASAFDYGASAAAASSMYLYKDITPKKVAKYLYAKGYGVRV